MNWNILYLDSIHDWLDSLDLQQYKSIAKELKLLELCGNRLKLPHSRSLGNSLFELRERKFGFRIYYSFNKEQTIILIHAGDKKSQKKDIKIAKARLKEYVKNN